MKAKIYSLLALFMAVTLLNACTDHTIVPDAPITIAGESNDDESSTESIEDGVRSDQLSHIAEDAYLISWILKDDIIKGVELDQPVISLQVEEGLAVRTYLSTGGLQNVPGVIEDHVMMSIIEDNIIFLTEYVDNVELRFVTEDHIMLLTFTVNGEPLFSHSFILKEGII